MKKLLPILCSVLFFCLRPYTAAGEGEGTESILVVSSYSPLRENGTRVIASLTKELRGTADRRIFVEYMDSEAAPDFTRWTAWMQEMLRAYQGKPPRLIVFLGGEALETYREVCPPEFRDIPVVIGMTKKAFIDYRPEASNQLRSPHEIIRLDSTFAEFRVNGYYYADYFNENVDFIRRLQPGIRHIAICYDNRYNYNAFENLMSAIIGPKEGLRFSYWLGNTLSTAGLLDSIAAAGDDTALLMAGWETDSNRYQQAYSMLHNELVRNGEILYEIQDYDFSNENYLGGYFVSGKDIGRDLAGLVNEVLAGDREAGSFEPTPSPPRYHVNYNTLLRAGIDPGLLPPDTVLYHSKPSLFARYPFEMSMLVSLALLLLFTGMAVLFFRRKREQHYRTASIKMKRLLESMPETAVIFDSRLNIVDIVNPRSEMLFDLADIDLIGKNLRDLEKHAPYFAEPAKIIARHAEQTLHTGKITNFSYELTTPRGTFHAQSRIVPYEKGQVIDFIRNTTAIRKNEVELENIRNELSIALEAGSLSAWVYDVAEDRYSSLHGNTLVDHTATIGDMLERTHPDSRQPLSEFMESLSRGRHAKRTGVFRFLREGDYGWYETHAIAHRLPDTGLIDRIVGTEKDITAQIEEQDELKESKFKLELAMEAAQVVPWDYDVQENFFYSTSEHSPFKHRRYTLETCTAELLHPGDQEAFRNAVRRLAEGSIDLLDKVLRTRSDEGRYEWAQLTARALGRSEDGKAVKIIGTRKYITESIEAENRLKAYIFKSDLAIEASGIFQWDYETATGLFSSPNPSSFMYGSLTLEDYLSIVHPDDAPYFRETIEKLLRGEEERMHVQVRVRTTPESGYRWGDIHGVIFERNADGKTTRITGLRRDITDAKNMTEELIVLRNKAEEANRLKTAFLANMSHEIRTPLNAIVGFSNLIAQTEDPAEVNEYCRIIETNNELLLQLINDILDLSKIEAGQLEFIFSEFSLSEVFHNLEQTYRYRVAEGVELVCDLPAEDHVVYSEKNRLTQVLSNFLSNACKFTTKGSVTLGYRAETDRFRFFVTDTGKGIAQEHLGGVFERFAKFDAFIQGTGLGLSICKTIADRLEGTIGVESEPGKGSTFWFTIPRGTFVEDRKPGTAATGKESPGQTRETGRGTGARPLLVAEDNDSNYLLLSSILKKRYPLVRALNGKEAVALHAEICPAAILMDIKMPIMDGLEATRHIRATDPNVPIIALTAHAFDEDRERAKEAGCTGFLTKPVNLKALLETLQSYIGD